MKFENFFRTVLIIISLGIFCYQMNNAWNKLASQPTKDQTTLVPLSDIDIKPLITICLDVNPDFKWLSCSPTGYSCSPSGLLSGIFLKNGKFTWVTKNMTFDEIVAKAYQADLFDGLLNDNYQGQNFIFPLASCRRLEFSPDMITLVQFLFDTPNFTIYITDPAHVTKFGLDMNSHTGSRIKISNTNSNYFLVKTKLFDMNNPEERHLCNQDANYQYGKCVDDYIQNDLQKVSTKHNDNIHKSETLKSGRTKSNEY